MFKAAMENGEHKMESYIFLETADKYLLQVEKAFSKYSQVIDKEVNVNGKGFTEDCAISLPDYVSSKTLILIVKYWKCFQENLTEEHLKKMDEAFNRMEKKTLIELLVAALGLQILHLESKIRNALKLRENSQEEEKLEPQKLETNNDRNSRLRNKLNARKEEKLKDGTKLKNVDVAGEGFKEESSIDDILLFINGTTQDKIGRKKNKKKNNKKKDKAKDPPKNVDQDPDKDDFVDDLDPELNEQITRDVEEFKRRISLSMDERLKTISSSKNKKLVPISMCKNV